MLDLHTLHRAPLALLQVFPFPSIDTHGAAVHFSVTVKWLIKKKKNPLLFLRIVLE